MYCFSDDVSFEAISEPDYLRDDYMDRWNNGGIALQS